MRLYMAPMEGVVDAQLRRIYSAIGGLDVAVTEFVRVTNTLLPSRVFLRLCPELRAPLPIPVRVQLLGSDPACLADNAAKAAALGAPAIDLNFGCPAKTVNRHRGGACLLQEPHLLHAIAQAVRRAVPPEVPVTAKMRLGFHAREGYLDCARALAEGGISELTVHARSRADGYRPPAYWHCLAEIRESIAIPLIANGEIWSVEDFLRCRAESGCQHFMLGRGLLARPDLARAIATRARGETCDELSWTDLLPILRDFQAATLLHYPRKYCGNRLKQWLNYLRRHYPEADALFQQIKNTREPEAIAAALASPESALINLAAQ